MPTVRDSTASGGVCRATRRADEQPGDDEAGVGQGVGRLSDPAVVGCLAEVRTAADVGAEPALPDGQCKQGDRHGGDARGRRDGAGHCQNQPSSSRVQLFLVITCAART